jgi:hypothetical protein
MLLLTPRMGKRWKSEVPSLAEICANWAKELSKEKAFLRPLISTWKFSEAVVKIKEQILGPSNLDQN